MRNINEQTLNNLLVNAGMAHRYGDKNEKIRYHNIMICDNDRPNDMSFIILPHIADDTQDIDAYTKHLVHRLHQIFDAYPNVQIRAQNIGTIKAH